MPVKLGLNAKLYRNAALPTAEPVWVEISTIKGATLNLSAAEADVTVRGLSGWRATVPTIQDASIDFEIVVSTEDPNLVVLQTAFLSRAPIELLVLDGPINVPGSQGLRAWFVITNFTRNEPLDNAITVNVSVKPTLVFGPTGAPVSPEWLVVP